MWQYTKQHQGEEGAPPVALKTRRSLRAVHFHPLGLPLVLTAEVNDVSAPVTLPFGVTAPVSPPQPPTPMPGPSLQAGDLTHEEPSRQLSSDMPADHMSAEMHQTDRLVERRAPRRLSEVFRALMEEEREEELLAQLESSASLQTQTSASRQILGLTHHSHAQLHRPQGPRASSPSLSHRASGGVGSLPHPPVPIRPLRPPSRPRSYHPLRHSIDADSMASTNSPVLFTGFIWGLCQTWRLWQTLLCSTCSDQALNFLPECKRYTQSEMFSQGSSSVDSCDNMTVWCQLATTARLICHDHFCHYQSPDRRTQAQ